jgi:ribosomal RNA-processing protein 1
MSKKRERQEVQHLEQCNSLPKRLAHNEKRVRDTAIAALAQWLDRRDVVSDVDMMTLWKGLFYCFWMSDKEAVQEELAVSMANLLHLVQHERAMLYLDCFYKTIRREWEGLDRLRMDKFMQLVRKFVFSSLQLLQRCDWNNMMVVWVTATMGSDLFEAKHRGLLMHLVDVLLPELTRLHQEGGHAMSALSLHHLLAPFYLIMGHCRDATVIKRVTQGVFEAIINIARDNEDHVLRAVILAMLPTMSDKLFRLASGADIQDSMRNRLYALRVACKDQIVRCKLDEMDIMDESIEEEGDEGDEGDTVDDSEMDTIETERLRESNGVQPRKNGRLPLSMVAEPHEPPALVPIAASPKPMVSKGGARSKNLASTNDNSLSQIAKPEAPPQKSPKPVAPLHVNLGKDSLKHTSGTPKKQLPKQQKEQTQPQPKRSPKMTRSKAAGRQRASDFF